MYPVSHRGEVAPSRRLWRLPSWLLNHVAGRANRLVSQYGRPGIRIRYAVLAGLDEFGPNSQAGLGRQLGIDRSDMVAVLNDLEREGLVLRAPDETDRRRNVIQITATGTESLRALDDQVNTAQDALLEPLSSDERVQLNELLQRLLEYHDGYRYVEDDERIETPSPLTIR